MSADDGDREREILRLRARLAELEHTAVSVDPVMRSIAAASPDSIMLLDEVGRIQFINRTAPSLTVEQVLGTDVFRYVSADQHPAMRACFDRVLATGEPGRYDSLFRLPDGTVTFWESRVGAVKRDGVVTGLAVLASNVTERRDAAADRDLFFRLSLDLYGVIAPDGRFRRVNPAFERTLGWCDAELIGHDFGELVHDDDVEHTRDALERLGSGEDVIDYVNRCRCRDGSFRTLSWRATSDVETGHIYAAARDVTDRIALEGQLRQSQKMDAVGQLAGGIAHDFNNLLLVMMVNAGLALETLADPAQAAARLGDIRLACKRARDLTKQLLTYSRRQPLEISAVSINDLVAGTVTLIERLLPEHIRVTFEPGAELPTVNADASQLEQVIMNLCLNARDAMPDGGALELRTRCVQLDEPPVAHPAVKPGRHVQLTVTDTGRGMDEDTRERLFEPFFTTKEPGQGSGLGLSTVYGIVQSHDGMIEVSTEPGRGSRFDVYLPAGDRSMKAVASKLEAAIRGGDETLLIAEDQDDVRRVVVAVLRQAGYRVHEARDGAEAVAMVAASAARFDLLILDVVMPVMSGPLAFARIDAVAPGTAVLFTSGYHESTGAHALPTGTIVLAKPYEAHDLLRAVRAALDARPRGARRATCAPATPA